jgi:hypothetical protein
MVPNADTSAVERIYFPGPGIVVGSRQIVTGEAHYRVRDLTIEDPSYFYAHPARAVALYCGAVEMFLGIGVGALYGSAALLCLAGVVSGSGLAGAIWVDDHRNPRRMELDAWYQGRHVVLFVSNDQRVFEQVRRAVVRALEANRPPRP